MSMPVGGNLLKTAQTIRLPLQYVPQKSMKDCANRLDMLREIVNWMQNGQAYAIIGWIEQRGGIDHAQHDWLWPRRVIL